MDLVVLAGCLGGEPSPLLTRKQNGRGYGVTPGPLLKDLMAEDLSLNTSMDTGNATLPSSALSMSRCDRTSISIKRSNGTERE